MRGRQTAQPLASGDGEGIIETRFLQRERVSSISFAVPVRRVYIVLIRARFFFDARLVPVQNFREIFRGLRSGDAIVARFREQVQAAFEYVSHRHRHFVFKRVRHFCPDVRQVLDDTLRELGIALRDLAHAGTADRARVPDARSHPTENLRPKLVRHHFR